MPYLRPSLAELEQQVQQDINAYLPGADSRLQFSFLDCLAKAQSGALHVLYGYMAWLVLQAFTDTAEAEYLDAEADDYGLSRQDATAATGNMTVTGSSGTNVPVDSIVQRADGVQYKVTADTLISGGTASVPVICLVTGTIGNSPANTQLSFVSPIGGVQANAVSGVLSGGTAIESDDRLRARLLARKRQPPQGGAEGDYDQWCLLYPGLTRSWSYPNEAGLNTLTIRFMMDGTYANGIPASGDATALLAILEPLRPVTLELFVSPPIAEPLNFTIALTPDTAAVRAAVEAELRDLILRDSRPGGTTLISRIREAVSIAAGETDNVVSVPSANVTASDNDHIHTMGAITWI